MNPLPPLTRRRWLTVAGASLLPLASGCDRLGNRRAPATAGSSDGGNAADAAPAGYEPLLDPPPPWVGEPTLNQAVVWLWSQQTREAADPADESAAATVGSWQSTKYALLRSGQALTPFVYASLARGRVPYFVLPCGLLWQRAEDFLRKSVNAAGVVGASDPQLLEYPNYATALTLQCLASLKNPDDRPLVQRMVRYLAAQQYSEANGFGPDHVCYGGWGFGGKKPVGDSAGHMDLGHTRHVLQALRAAGHNDPETYARAQRFLRLLQKHPDEDRPQPSAQEIERPKDWRPPYDGGFYFSPIVHAANKGGELRDDAGQPYFGSYATATCDGLLALALCGVPRDDERVQAAAEWLSRHPRLDLPEGVPEGTDTNWGPSIRYYHFAARAECYAAMDWPGEWRTELRTILQKLQQPDGSFVNGEGFLMKEDDPLVCTALAVCALASCGTAA